MPERIHLKVLLLKIRPSPNCGRSSGDRQYFFINKRPINLPKAKKVINELYRVYNSLQYPSFILNISLSDDAFDRNLTPDKLEVVLQNESELINSISESIASFYAIEQSKFRGPSSVTSTKKAPSEAAASEQPPRFHKDITPEMVRNMVSVDSEVEAVFSFERARKYVPVDPPSFKTVKKYTIESQLDLPKQDLLKMRGLWINVSHWTVQ
jgi:DNA mismatch repair ATPase MutL